MSMNIRELNQYFIDLWWQSDTSLPDLGPVYTPSKQAEREEQLEQFLRLINYELANPPRGREEVQALKARLEDAFIHFAQDALGVTEQQSKMLPFQAFFEATEDFVHKARTYDPHLGAEDIYQANRNAWTANGLQWLMGLPLETNPSIFAYSLLYPYTDNFLDDGAIPIATKLAFNEHFRQRLEDQQIAFTNAHEEIIFDLVGMIEKQYARERYPEVFESLLDIHAAQSKSLLLVRPDSTPSEADVIRISFEKGGTSVMADGYLVNGTLSPVHQQFTYGHGIFAQLLDDMEDIEQDCRAERLTVYSRAAAHCKLDTLANHTFQFSNKVLEGLDCFDIPKSVKDLIRNNSFSMLTGTAGRTAHFYTESYLHELEAHSPFRFSFLNRLSNDFMLKHGSIMMLIESLAVSNG